MFRNSIFWILTLLLSLDPIEIGQERLYDGDNHLRAGRKSIPVPNRLESREIGVLMIEIPKIASLYRNTTFPPISSTNDLGKLVNKELTGSVLHDPDKNQLNANATPAEHDYQPHPTRGQISIVFDNDIFANRDFYYTNGLKIIVAIPGMNHSPINKVLAGIPRAAIEFSGLTISQNIYTPTNPDTSIVLYGDRPFASYLAFGQFRETFDLTRKLRMRSELNVGALGPASFGRQVQSSIHEIEPVGWQNQVENDMVISYSFELEKGLISNSALEINVTGMATAGTLYNKMGGGFYLRTGNFMPVYRGPFSYFENVNPGGRYQFWFFTSGTAEFIAYDATLQGGMFSNENIYTISAVDIKRAVFRASAGFALYYNNIGIEYEHFYITPEFNGAQHFLWGRIKAVLAF